MKHFNLFSVIALFCLAAGFVSCTKTGNENPNVEQDEEILFVIDEATDKANPEIREGLVRCGFIVEVCNPSKLDESVLRAGSIALFYFIGAGFSEEVFKPGAAFASLGLNYLGSTELMMDPAFITVAANSEAVKASSEAIVTASPACYALLGSLPAYQMAQLESALAQSIVAEPGMSIAMEYYDSVEELPVSIAKLTRTSENKSYVLPISGVALPAYICSRVVVKSGDREEAILRCASRAILAGDLAIRPMYAEGGYTLVNEAEHAALKSPEDQIVLQQAYLLNDMQLVGGRYEMVARAEIRKAVAFINDLEFENINVKSGEPITAGSIIRRRLEEVVNLKMIEGCDRLPYTTQQFLAVNYPDLAKDAAKEFVICSMDHALAAKTFEAEIPNIEVSTMAAGLLMALDEQKALDSKISSAFNGHLAAHFAEGRAVYLMSAEEAGIALRSGEKAEAAKVKILPVFAAKDVFICSNRSLLKAETDSENYFAKALLNCGLMLCNREKVAEEFLDPRMADDFSRYEYTPDGVNYYSSFLEAMKAAVAGGIGYTIEVKGKAIQ
ncbi:MAG: hypothetical protein MJY46_01290 [Bacteroidales bacterium]|nr:hypothetical protein [Bacteroidales bacterium]